MKFILVIWLLFIGCTVFGQANYYLNFNSQEVRQITRKPQTVFKDSLEALNYLALLQQKAIKKGYLTCSIDSLLYQKQEFQVCFFVGPKFKEAKLTLEKKNSDKLKLPTKTIEKLILSSAFNPVEIWKLLKFIQTSYQDLGYPFVRVQLDSIAITDGNLTGKIKIEEHQQFHWGEIIIKGESIISQSILETYLQLKPGMIYTENQTSTIEKKLNQIPFLEQSKSFELLFHDNKVDLYLYLQSKPVSLITGVVGLQPKINNTGYSLTGDIRMKLVNVLKRAESVEAQWRNLQGNTQSLKTAVQVPTLFKTPFGMDGQFQLYKKDSTFLELKSTLAIQYLLGNGNTLKLFYRNYQSSLLSAGQTNANKQNLGSISTPFYGISISRQTIDYLPCPTSGYQFQLEGSIGKRKRTDSLNVQGKYETTSKIEWNWNSYFTFRKRHILKFSNAIDIYIAPNYVKNELLRFGGMATQRGFKEEELRATSRLFASFEYRFLLDQTSYLFLFYDQSWYENKIATVKRDRPLGFGAGLTFGTTIGMFSISYALGKQLNNPIEYRNGNVHFGYVSYF
jgi:outer membrane protein assembly factor BamA